MISITVEGVLRDFRGWLRQVRRGESLVIVDRKRPVAELKPVAEKRASAPSGAESEDLESQIDQLYLEIRDLLSRGSVGRSVAAQVEDKRRRLCSLQRREADLMEQRAEARLRFQPAEGRALLDRARKLLDGMTQIEHWIPTSREPARAGDYRNCFYICRYCNRARSAAPIAEEGGEGRLLNPCDSIWQESFSLAGDELEPRRDDTAAAYTLATYDLNDPGKTARRRRRRKVSGERLSFIEQAEKARERLLEKGIRNREPELVDLASLLEQALRRAWQDLERFRVVPADAQCPCACGDEELCEIPGVLGEQILEVVREGRWLST
jgi:antitoxin (DNA-binding transcriptional repressor) of toxin-antitoxin stability system